MIKIVATMDDDVEVMNEPTSPNRAGSPAYVSSSPGTVTLATFLFVFFVYMYSRQTNVCNLVTMRTS